MQSIILKKIILHVLLIPFYFFTKQEIMQINPEHLDTLVLFVGLIVIAPITSFFIYSYSKTNNQKSLALGHLTTFFSALVIGILFSTLDILLIQMVGLVYSFRIALILFWIAVITFDFADFSLKND